jgi:hypothetical protein
MRAADRTMAHRKAQLSAEQEAAIERLKALHRGVRAAPDVEDGSITTGIFLALESLVRRDVKHIDAALDEGARWTQILREVIA